MPVQPFLKEDHSKVDKPIVSQADKDERYNIMLALLVACIKEFGKDNVLALHDHNIKNPFDIKIDYQTGDDEVRLVLLEGQEAIDEWKTFSTTTVADYVKENI